MPTDWSGASCVVDRRRGPGGGADHQVPITIYQAAAVTAFNVPDVAEIAHLVGCYALIAILLNTFDVNLPGTEIG